MAKNIKQYIQGDDIALLVNVVGTNINLADFEIELQVYTKGYKSSICASTTDGDHSSVVIRRTSTLFGVNIPGSVTMTMVPGTYLAQTTYTHRETNTSRTFTNEVFVISKKNHCHHE